jgi:hypothetical protein
MSPDHNYISVNLHVLTIFFFLFEFIYKKENFKEVRILTWNTRGCLPPS